MTPTPYSCEDLFRPSSEGRSYHDNVAWFYRVFVTGIAPPKEVPPLERVIAGINHCEGVEDERGSNILASLRMTPQKKLWPGCSALPSTLAAQLWQAADQTASITSESSWCSAPSESGNTDVPVVITAPVASADLSRPKGRKIGSTKWTDKEIHLLLATVGRILPVGRDMWDAVVAECVGIDPTWRRNATGCKRKFHLLALRTKPTGSSHIPGDVQWAQQIHENIRTKESIGFSGLNDEEFERIADEVDNTVAATTATTIEGNTAASIAELVEKQAGKLSRARIATGLFSAEGTPVRPLPRKRKADMLASTMLDMHNSTNELSNKLSGCLGELISVMKAPPPNHSTDDSNKRLDAMGRKCAMLEKTCTELKEANSDLKVACGGLSQQLNAMFDYMKNN